MKHRRTPAVNNNGSAFGVNNDDEESNNNRAESFFPKRRSSKKKGSSSLPIKLRRQHQVHWSAAAIVLLLTSIAFFCYTLQIIYLTQRATDSRRSNVPSNWWNPNEHSHLLQRCTIPFLPFEHNPIWRCYNDLVDENYDTVVRANQLFHHDSQNYSGGPRVAKNCCFLNENQKGKQTQPPSYQEYAM